MDEAVSASKPNPFADRILMVAGLTAAVCGGLYGYDTGIISGALFSMTREFDLSHQMQETVAASILAGAVLGALITSWFSERYGRKATVLIVAGLFAVGAGACALAPKVGSLIAARLFLGFAVGGSTQVVPMYISELAPPERRGQLVTMFNVAIGIGIVIANLVGYGLRDSWTWREMVAVAAVPAAIVFFVMLFMPSSPRWIAERRRLGEAAKILQSIRTSHAEIRDELNQIYDVSNAAAQEDAGWKGICKPWVRPALIAALGVAFFTQCGGLEMMIYYSPTFLADAGFGRNSALLASVGVALVYALVTFLGCLFVDRIGRRRLMLIMIPGSVISLIGLGIMFAFGRHEGWEATLTVVFLLLFMMFNSAGIQICGWLLGSEMFPLAMRGPATALHAAMLWGSNLLVTGTALSVVNAVGLGATMWIYAAVNLASLVFVYFFVPETAGASLEDIEGALREGRFKPSRTSSSVLRIAANSEPMFITKPEPGVAPLKVVE
ncbi:sugar porter family MFS transporter [Beijerinckia indica]|uniref:sugar porter family MFS transporter n=1 Tax=Beijerinckia indica TaxID=533 RepID=UPI001FCCBAB8|nr:sugar porter family MFS transporter [Beijerinckia indica]